MTDGALKALKNHQRQLDADGCEVGVSRQALEEVIVAFEALRRTRDDLHEANSRYQQEVRDERALAGKGVKAVEALIDALAPKAEELAVAAAEIERLTGKNRELLDRCWRLDNRAEIAEALSALEPAAPEGQQEATGTPCAICGGPFDNDLLSDICVSCEAEAPWRENATRPAEQAATRKFAIGDRVTKTKGSSWTGRVVGFYSTALTPIGYAVESETETGSVQIYPEAALRRKA